MRTTKKVKDDILDILEHTYKNTSTALNYSTSFEFLVAVVLSAQCTDERVNQITAKLFSKYNTPEKILALGQAGLEEQIKGCGLYHNKARNILATCEIICREYGGNVPATFDELTKLPGVGRKTANVLLSQLFGTPAIAVDTHVFRVSNRLRLANGKTPQEVEEDLMKVIPREKWAEAHHWLIWHGRRVCRARKPLCDDCPVESLCYSSAAGKK